MEIGIDVVDILRFKQAVEKWGEIFLHRVFTEREISLYKNRINSLAVRFAGKEAFYKALGKGNLIWKEIEITGNDKPLITLYGKTKEIINNKKVSISLSHEKKFAVAVVLIFEPLASETESMIYFYASV